MKIASGVGPGGDKVASRNASVECGPNVTLASASRGVLQEDSKSLDSYSLWSNQRVHMYPHSSFLPTEAYPCQGMAVHWATNSTTWMLAVAVRAKGWAAFGLSEMGGMRGADVVYFDVSTLRLYDAYVADYNGPPELDTRQDWSLTSYNITTDGYLIFEAQRALNTYDAQDWPVYNDASELVAKHKVIGAWGDTPYISYHGNKWISATLQLVYPMTSTINHTYNWSSNDTEGGVDDYDDQNDEEGQQLAVFRQEMKRRSDGSVLLAIQDPYRIPQKESSSHEYCYTSSKLSKAGFPKTVASSTGLFIVGIEFVIPNESINYVDRIYIFGHPNMHYWFLSSCSDHSIGPSFIWTRGRDFFSFPTDTGFFISKDASNALSLHVHFNNFNLSADASGSGVGARLYYSKKKQTQHVATILLGDPMVGMTGTAIGNGWTQHSFTCPSSCADYILLTAPNNGEVTVFQENFYMHGNGKRMVNQILRNGTIVHEASVDFWDFSQAGFMQIPQEPYILKRGDEIRTICYYEGDSMTTFGLGFQNEICMATLMYYPAQENVFRSLCEPDNLLVSVCTEEYSAVTLQGEEEIGRVFGQDRYIYTQTMTPNISPPTLSPSLVDESKAVWSDVIKGFLILALLAMVFFNFLVWVMRKTRRRWEAKQLQLEMNNDLELL